MVITKSKKPELSLDQDKSNENSGCTLATLKALMKSLILQFSNHLNSNRLLLSLALTRCLFNWTSGQESLKGGGRVVFIAQGKNPIVTPTVQEIRMCQMHRVLAPGRVWHVQISNDQLAVGGGRRVRRSIGRRVRWQGPMEGSLEWVWRAPDASGARSSSVWRMQPCTPALAMRQTRPAASWLASDTPLKTVFTLNHNSSKTVSTPIDLGNILQLLSAKFGKCAPHLNIRLT
jgi:hypothetical protein